MAGVIGTGNHPKALWPGVHAFFGAKYNEFPMEWEEIFDVRPSGKNFEQDVKLTGFGLAPIKTQGGSVQYDSETQGYIKTYTHVVYGLGFVVTREEMEDCLYAEVGQQRAGRLAYSMRQTKETVGANVLNRAFNSSYTGGDGKELLATDHPIQSGTFSNELDPAADLSEASLEDLVVQMGGAVNERNLKIKLMPRKLIVPRQLFFEAHRILDSVLQNDTANNAVNVLRSQNVFPEGISVNHYLTDVDAFFIKTDVPNGLTLFQRREIEFTQDNDFDTENAKAKSTERYVVGWTDPLGLYGSAGA